MDGLTKDGLNGQRVAVTGHLACVSHRQAANLIRSLGGVYTSTVNQRTSMLVVGGWPLKADGRLTNKLRAVRELQRQGISITIRSEEDLLSELRHEGDIENAARLYNLAELALLLKVPQERIRRWFGAG